MGNSSNLLRCVLAVNDANLLSEWAATCVRSLLWTEVVDVVGLVVIKGNDTVHVPGQGWSEFLLNMYRKLAYRKTHSLKRSPSKVLQQLPCIHLQSGTSWTDGEIARVQDMNPDFILNLTIGPHQMPSPVTTQARYGAWFFQFGRGPYLEIDAPLPDRRCRASIPGMFEVLSGETVTRISLIQQRAEGLYVLQEGWMPTQNGSLATQLTHCLAFGVEWPAKICRELAKHRMYECPAFVQASCDAQQPNMRIFGALLKRKIAVNIRRFASRWLSEHWSVGVIHSPVGEMLRAELQPEVHWLKGNENQGFLADPFPLYEPGVGHFVFAEYYDYRQARGNISMVKYSRANPEEPVSVSLQPVLNLPYHLSYPYLFRFDNQLYCIPESHQARQVCLYRASGFPYSWEKVGVLLNNFAAIDSTLFHYDGYWWLFCTNADSNANSHLYAFYADDLSGLWHPHLCNPIKSDVRSSRPGGRPFWHEGVLYRPAQDCAKTYGGRLVLNRIKVLTPTDFAEQAVTVLEPFLNSPYSKGLHTLNSDGGITVVDGKTYRFVPLYIWGELKKKVCRRFGADRNKHSNPVPTSDVWNQSLKGGT